MEVNCVCGEKQELEKLVDHLRGEHIHVDLSFCCGICDFCATSEINYIRHCVSEGHDPRRDNKLMVKL